MEKIILMMEEKNGKMPANAKLIYNPSSLHLVLSQKCFVSSRRSLNIKFYDR